MRLVDWARRQGISYKTAWRWVKDDMMPVPWRQTSSGTILVDAPADDLPAAVALYARVSSHDQRRDLDRQLARLPQYAAEHKLHVVETAAEVGSGLNGKRRKLLRLLSDASVGAIVAPGIGLSAGRQIAGTRHSKKPSPSTPAQGFWSVEGSRLAVGHR